MDYERVKVDKLDKILGKEFKVLDKGFIRIVDYMGGDDSIVQAARVSYGKGTKKINEDRGLIRYLLRNRHSTPFEMCEIKLHVKVPMDTWRQWIRHRTANVNEYSTRYSIAIDAFQETSFDRWREQAINNKQGSGNFLDLEIAKGLSIQESKFHEGARQLYKDRINKGVAREQARKDLPLSTYTEAYWKIDLHNLLHFLALRMDSHAQFEIREYANIIGQKIVKEWCPLTWEAFCDYRVESLNLSNTDVLLINFLINNKKSFIQKAIEIGFLDQNAKPKKNRERLEFELKIKKIGIPIPW